ncbi:MAG TPA: S41 family peptidase, partial [Candidatus Ozemobacteraceae bacterium]|nr:S41 family peptidase [Candidatus Ozemobacteraceae bacterium]
FVATLAVALLVLLSIPGILPATSTNITYFKSLDLIRKVIEIIKSDYVEENIEEQKLIYGAIEGMLKTLEDPYTRFMEPKSFKEMQTETQGEFGGLGIVISIKNRLLTVVSPIEDTPAWRAGIRSGDMILRIDNKDVTDIPLHDAVRLLRGPEGSKVTISIVRENEKEPRDVTLVREIIKIPSIKYWIIKPNIGYIRLTQFIQTSSEDLEKAMLALEKGGAKALILDVRNNPGGLLTAAVEVCRKFIPKGDIVSIKGRDGEKNTYGSFFQSHPLIPMVLLINEGSASASEIVAGALKDNRRAVIIGKKSFGKGSVQTVISLTDGSAIALTTALYYSPAGVNIHKKGIEPDIEVELPRLNEKEREDAAKSMKAEEDILRQRDADRRDGKVSSETVELSGWAEPPDSLSRGSLQPYVVNKYDTQLTAAVKVLNFEDAFGQMLKRLENPDSSGSAK